MVEVECIEFGRWLEPFGMSIAHGLSWKKYSRLYLGSTYSIL